MKFQSKVMLIGMMESAEIHIVVRINKQLNFPSLFALHLCNDIYSV